MLYNKSLAQKRALNEVLFTFNMGTTNLFKTCLFLIKNRPSVQQDQHDYRDNFSGQAVKLFFG